MNTIIYTPEEEIKFKNELKLLDINHPISYCTLIKANKQLLAFINQQTQQLQDPFYKLPTKIYWVLNDLTDFPKCQHCGKKFNMRNVKRSGYPITCSQKCSALSVKRKLKIKQTCLDKYGVEHPAQTAQFKEKYKQTCLKKYGKSHTFAVPSIKEKTKQTCLDKYGVEFISQACFFKEKTKQTCLKNYGVDYSLQADIVKEKSKQTCLKKYGVENPAQNKDIKEKVKQTCLDKYGVDNPTKSKLIKEKIKATMLKRYGVENSMQNTSIRRSASKKYQYKSIMFDSAPELALYIYLKDHNIPFTYQPETDFCYTFNNKQHKYMPDFKINDRYVEIKGNHLLDKETNTWVNPWNSDLNELYEAKHQCCLDNNVKILYTNTYMSYVNYVNDKYGKDYLKKFKTAEG